MSAVSLTDIAGRIILLDGWRAALLALAAGAVSALGLAPYHAFPVAFITLPILVLLLDGALPPAGSGGIFGFIHRLWPAFRTGWLFGFGYLLAGMWWVGKAFLVDADEFLWLLPLAVVALPAGLALFYGLGAVLARLVWCDGWRRLLALAAGLTIAEWLRGFVLTGLPWNTLGMILMPSPALMQSAGVIGLYGVTFLAVFMAASPAIFAPSGAIDPKTGTRKPRRVRGVLITALALFMLHAGYGFVILSNTTDAVQPDIRLRIVQPAIDQREKWKPENTEKISTAYLDLSNTNRGPESVSVASFTHLIWPESAFPFVLTRNRKFLAAIGAMLPPTTTLITGAMRVEQSADPSGSQRVYNTLYLINGEGEIAAAYDKARLVPFGEFLPFQEYLESLGLQQLTRQRGGFEPGSRRQTLANSSTPPFLPLICYEIIFPGAVLGDGPKPQWIVNITNDAWFGNSAGPYQHAHQARIRAVEEGLPLVRAANSGISMITDARGRVRSSLGVNRQGVVDGSLPLPVDTAFSRLRNMPLWVALIFVCMFLIVSRWRLSRSTP